MCELMFLSIHNPGFSILSIKERHVKLSIISGQGSVFVLL